jgi:hypothetical protein
MWMCTFMAPLHRFYSDPVRSQCLGKQSTPSLRCPGWARKWELERAQVGLHDQLITTGAQADNDTLWGRALVECPSLSCSAKLRISGAAQNILYTDLDLHPRTGGTADITRTSYTKHCDQDLHLLGPKFMLQTEITTMLFSTV